MLGQSIPLPLTRGNDQAEIILKEDGGLKMLDLGVEGIISGGL